MNEVSVYSEILKGRLYLIIIKVIEFLFLKSFFLVFFLSSPETLLPWQLRHVGSDVVVRLAAFVVHQLCGAIERIARAEPRAIHV
jgi:hypothetical protein